jgi:hypothetical protein
MSSVRDRLKAANEVESPDERIALALSRLPRRLQCKFVDADGVIRRERRVGTSWCDTHKEIVFDRKISARDKQLVARLPAVEAKG